MIFINHQHIIYCKIPLHQEAHSLSLDLEDSLKKLKEIKSANVKLTGQLKIGQEALRLEQVEVKKLKEQIEARRQVHT